MNSTKVAVSRLWNDYEKFRKSRSQNGGEKKLSEFLNTKFIPPQRASVVSTRPQENICLINASRDASSTAMSISKSLLLENLNLEAYKISLQSKLSSSFTGIQALTKTSESTSKKNRFLKEKFRESKQAVKRTKRREEYWKSKWTKLDTSVDKRLGNHEQVIHELQEENDHLNNEVKVHQQTLREKEYEIFLLTEQLQGAENKVVRHFDNKQKSFTPELSMSVSTLCLSIMFQQHN